MSESLFKSTAKYYAAYRVPYPDELMGRLVADCNLDGRQRLLDLGCGTGQVFLPLAPHVGSVVAVDPDAGMLKYAARETARCGYANVNFVKAKAEEISIPFGTFDLVTAGASFHWMDRNAVGRAIASDLLVPGGKLAILGSNSLWHGAEPWHAVAREVIRRWLGENRRAGTGVFSAPSEPHQAVLTRLGYTIEEATFEIRHEWSVKTFLGYLYSTSFSSLDLLGDNRSRFEADLQGALRVHNPSGRYAETLRFYFILATPPSP